MYPFEAIIEYWDEYVGEMRTAHGVTIAPGFAEAMASFDNYYGKDLNKITLAALEDNEVYILEDAQDEMFHGLIKIKGEIKEW